MIWIFPISGGLALLLSMVAMVLSQRKSTPERWLSRVAVAAGVAWTVTVLEICTFVIMFRE